jgi:indolepyruvate ferredoxin oxidoreductase alpha subunit
MSSPDATPFEPPHVASRPAASPAGHLAIEILRAGIERIYVVPGSPASELISELRLLGAWLRDARDEKSAAEAAMGAARMGIGAAVLIKGNGTPLALEPLHNAAAHGVLAPLLLLVGDDTRSDSSTVPTDARPLADAARIPVIELIGPSTARAALNAATRTSCDIGGPVLVRFTATYHHATSVPASELKPGESRHGGPPVLPLDHTAHRLTKDSRWEDYELRRRSAAHVWSGRAPRMRADGEGTIGVLMSGALWSSTISDPVRDLGLPVLVLSMVAPLPPDVIDFADGLTELLVLEEGTPFLEQAVRNELSIHRSACTVLGQQTWHVRSRGVRSADEILAAVSGQLVDLDPPVVWKKAAHRVDHPYRVLFEALRDVRLRRHPIVSSCVGSCIDGTALPWDVIDIALNLGGSVNVAAGAADASGCKAIALVGDYGLFHSGMSGHDQVYQHQSQVLTIVVANGRSDKTGGHETALATSLGAHERRDLAAMLQASAGADRVHRVRLGSLSKAQLARVIEDLLELLPATLVVEVGECVDTGTWSTDERP